MVCQRDICQILGINKRYICLFGDNSPATKDPVPTCALVPKLNVLAININAMKGTKIVIISNVAKRILIMQNDILSIILIHEVKKIYDFIKCLS